MGADGGLMWIALKEGKTHGDFRDIIWFFHRVENQSAYAYKGEFAEDPNNFSCEKGWLEGGYGTDCEFDFEYLIDLIEFCTSDQEWGWHFKDGSTDIRDMTFQELIDSLKTHPKFNIKEWSVYRLYSYSYDEWYNTRALGLITDSIVSELKGYSHSIIPKEFKNITLREWGERAARVIDIHKTIRMEETWT